MKVFWLSIGVVIIAVAFYYHDNLKSYFHWENLKSSDDAIIDLATIDLSKSSSHEETSQMIYKAFSDYGFAYVTGIKDFDEDELHTWTKWFFDLPLSVKMAIAKKAFNESSYNIYRGYFPVVPQKTSYKEAFETGIFESDTAKFTVTDASEIRNLSKTSNGRLYMHHILQEKNSWPNSDDETSNKEFRRIMRKYYHIYQSTLIEIFKYCVSSLGVTDPKYEDWFNEKSLSTLRLLHYPTRINEPDSIPDAAKDGDIRITTAAHYDTGILTLLATFNYTGLQIRPTGYKNWIDVPPKKNHLVVNIGAMLASFSDKQFVATDHRVIDTGSDRYSLPMFFEPRVDADVSKTFSGKVNKLVGNFTRYGPWMTNRTSQFTEYATSDFGVYVPQHV